ncbi:MAG: spore cortex-lytic enzyme [Clostridiales bacterium]|nr:spore cortex-lytic enzyme [Clostridiales bacterium]
MEKSKVLSNEKSIRLQVILVCALTALLVVCACFCAPYKADAYVVKGNTPANIRAVQQRLSNLGYYNYKVDGIWGWRTSNAVKKFQRDYGLVADGIVGKNTEKALKITLGGSSSSSSLSTSERNLLARCVYAEARGEPYAGQVAIAAVVLNRVRSSSFPNTVSGVIYQKGAFTCVSDGQINMTPNSTAYKAVTDAMNGWDPTNGCLYYYNPATATSKWIWSLKVELTIGRHSFAKA